MKNMVRMRRRIVFAGIAAVIAGGLFLGFRPQPISVDVGHARHGPLRVTVEQEGKTRVVDRYVISTPIAAFARRISLDVGDPVESGAPLVHLEPVRAEVLDPRRRAEAEARVAAAQDNIRAAEQRAKAARASADLARKDLTRIRTLRAGGHVTADAEDRAATEVDRKDSEMRSAEFAVATATHEMEAARTALRFASGRGEGSTETIVLHAPVAGQVLHIPRKSEGPVAAGQALIEIGDPQVLEAQIDVLSADAVRIQPGTRVLFERWGGEGALEGVVRVVEPVGFTKVSALGVEEQRVWVIVAFTSPPQKWQRLGDGYRVEASFILWESQDILQVPASALFRDGAGWAVFAVNKGRAAKRAVLVGERSGLSAQILSGINSGDTVIVHPDAQVEDGVRVVVR